MGTVKKPCIPSVKLLVPARALTLQMGTASRDLSGEYMDQETGTKAPRSDPIYAVKDPKRLLTPARVLVILSLVFAVAGIGSDALELRFYLKLESGQFVSDPQMMAAAESNDQRQIILYVAHMTVLVLTFIFVGRWIYFSSRNLRAFGAIGLSIRPGWAVGWYFIPIANIWKPYEAMKEIWQASSDPMDWPDQRTPGLMPAWWALWLISGFAGRVLNRLSSQAESIAELKFAITMGMVSGGLYVALCVVFVTLMARISQLQIDALENKGTLAVFGP